VIVDGRELYPEEFPTINNNDSLKFCHLLAFTSMLIEADGMIQDTEYTWKEIKEFFSSLSMQWRSMLLKSDQILGLGLESDAAGVARQGLYLMLEFYQSKFHDFMREIREEKEPDDNDEEDEDEELNGNNEDEETDENEFAPFPPFDG
jgi:hypothetical protein